MGRRNGLWAIESLPTSLQDSSLNFTYILTLICISSPTATIVEYLAWLSARQILPIPVGCIAQWYPDTVRWRRHDIGQHESHSEKVIPFHFSINPRVSQFGASVSFILNNC